MSVDLSLVFADFPPRAAVILEVIKALLSLGLLGITWVIGQKIIDIWERRKKRQELDTAAATQFQQLYGEAKEVARLWREVAKPHGHPPQVSLPLGDPLQKPSDIRWQLFTRATAVEGKFEAIAIKLSTERALEERERRSIGLFRQMCQDLRESIRDNNSLPAIRGEGYTLFNNLAAELTHLLGSSRPDRSPSPQSAQQNLEAIVAIGSSAVRAEVKRIEDKRSVSKTGEKNGLSSACS